MEQARDQSTEPRALRALEAAHLPRRTGSRIRCRRRSAGSHSSRRRGRPANYHWSQVLPPRKGLCRFRRAGDGLQTGGAAAARRARSRRCGGRNGSHAEFRDVNLKVARGVPDAPFTIESSRRSWKASGYNSRGAMTQQVPEIRSRAGACGCSAREVDAPEWGTPSSSRRRRRSGGTEPLLVNRPKISRSAGRRVRIVAPRGRPQSTHRAAGVLVLGVVAATPEKMSYNRVSIFVYC